MNEADLKGALVKLAREMMPGWVILRHEDHFTHGIPDISFTGKKRTSWVEVKFANPDFKCKGIQELTLSRLALAGLAWFVVYYERNGVRRTYIVNPSEIGKPIEHWTRFVDGFAHAWVLSQITEAHR